MNDEEDEEGLLHLRLELEGKDKERFRKIKTYYGVRNNIECLRLVIREKYKEIKKEEGRLIE